MWYFPTASAARSGMRPIRCSSSRPPARVVDVDGNKYVDLLVGVGGNASWSWASRGASESSRAARADGQSVDADRDVAYDGRAYSRTYALSRAATGTFTENPLSIAAGLAVLDVLKREPALERADRAADLLREGLLARFSAHGVRAVVSGVASILQVHFGTEVVEDRRDVVRANTEATRELLLGMVSGGVLWPQCTRPSHSRRIAQRTSSEYCRS